MNIRSPQALRNEGEAAIRLRRMLVNIEEDKRGEGKRKYKITIYNKC